MTTIKSGTILGLRPGDILDGRFRIGRLIGYGGQGAVLGVTHLEWERQLALKLPLPDAVNSPKKRERFEQEAETWIRLGVHPNIVRCWFVRKVNELPGLFLDLIPGGSLEDKIKNEQIGPGHWTEIVETLIQVAEGLSHSHAMGVVHRDIKPENLLLGLEGQVYVTDFGLVKSTDREEMVANEAEFFAQLSKNSGLTGVGEFLGTPRYGAPEQWNKAMVITPATDVYALGVILYELICGRRPFDSPGENPDPLELIHRHLKLPPPNPKDFQSDIPDQLVSLALACLSKDPVQRPKNGGKLVKLLADAMQKIDHKSYTRPAPVPEKERADLLNNAAVSLHSLGKGDKCRENLEKGLLLQADHPECLYNLVQIDRRAGRMTNVDALQRLRRANLTFPLALLCIEEGHAKLACEIFRTMPETKKNGLVHRTEGDALMYLGQYSEASKCYGKARIRLPSDKATVTRQQLALSSVRELDGTIYFPSTTSCFKGQSPPSQTRLLLTENGRSVLRLSDSAVGILDITTRQAKLEKRPHEASSVTDYWQSGSALLLQDKDGFELWDTETLKPAMRAPGKVLAVSKALSHIIYRSDRQLFLLDKERRATNQIQWATGDLGIEVIACFNSNQTSLFLLAPDGSLGQLDPHCRVLPLAWPRALLREARPVTFGVHHRGLLALASSDSVVQLLNLENRMSVYKHKLPFLPTRLDFDSTGKVLVARAAQLFGVFDQYGSIIYRGKGPCALDSQGKYLLFWLNGFLTLYALAPFRRIRAWSEQIAPPVHLEMSQDGRRALTVSRTGEFLVWEVDEDNRVFERELLLTPGEGYEELLSSYDSYQTALSQAFQLAGKGEHFESYLAVRRARSAKGFLQSEDALALHWQLCRTLQRTGLEALWERMFYRGIAANGASPDGSLLALCRGIRCTLSEFQGASTQTRASFDLGSRALACHFYSQSSDEILVFIVESKGILHSYRAADGALLDSINLDLGFLVQAIFDNDHLLVLSKENVARSYSLNSKKLSPDCEIPRGKGTSLFALPGHRAIYCSKEDNRVLDLAKNAWTNKFPLTLAELPGALTHLSSAEGGTLLLAGFSDGTIMVGDSSSGEVLFTTQQDVGAITGIAVCPALAIGVAVSAKGRLSIFDLNDGFVFQSFTAHSDAVAEVQAFANGRYFTTRTQRGEFRLWETCWKVSEAKGAMTVNWMPSGGLGKLSRLFRLS